MPSARMRAALAPQRSLPSNKYVPARTGIRPESARIRVVFPAPLEPTNAVISPRRTTMSTPHSTSISPYPARNPCSSRIKGSAMSCMPFRVLLTEISIYHRGILDYLARLSFGDQPAVVQHGYSRADVQDNLHQ